MFRKRNHGGCGRWQRLRKLAKSEAVENAESESARTVDIGSLIIAGKRSVVYHGTQGCNHVILGKYWVDQPRRSATNVTKGHSRECSQQSHQNHSLDHFTADVRDKQQSPALRTAAIFFALVIR
jgi:hypothetical protein